MHVNNEIGVIQDIESIGKLARKKLFFMLMQLKAQKIEIDLEKMNVDLMSFSAHKIYGPKGIGALYVRRKPELGSKPRYMAEDMREDYDRTIPTSNYWHGWLSELQRKRWKMITKRYLN